MTIRKTSWLVALLAGVLTVAGCCHDRRSCYPPSPGCDTCGPARPFHGRMVPAPLPPAPGVYPPPAVVGPGGLPPAPTPPVGAGTVPPGAELGTPVPTPESRFTPLPSESVPPADSTPPAPVPPGPPPGTAAAPPDTQGSPPGTAAAPPDTQGPPMARLGPIQPLEPERREAARPPSPPESKAPPATSVPAKPAPPKTEEDRDTTPPIDIPGFATALPGVASGLAPFPDGFDWLKTKGYKTVLHLRLPGEDSAAARRQAEKKGLRYVTLEVSPARLTQDLANQFSKLVTDSSVQPLFVYDKDGSLAGALWYLYFRQAARLTQEKALEEATRLGLKKDGDPDRQVMWLAIQKLLEKNG